MIRLGSLFWLVLVSAAGFAMFGVKYQVQALEDQLARTNRATAAEEHELRVLEAEWAYLTRPETLETMNKRFLSLGPMTTKQLHATAADIPSRPPPPAPPPVEAPAVVAAAEPVATADAPPSATEGVPVNTPEAASAQTAAEPPATQSALRAMPALLEKPTAAPLAKTVPTKVVAKPGPSRRARSLDDLIAQIMTSR